MSAMQNTPGFLLTNWTAAYSGVPLFPADCRVRLDLAFGGVRPAWRAELTRDSAGRLTESGAQPAGESARKDPFGGVHDLHRHVVIDHDRGDLDPLVCRVLRGENLCEHGFAVAAASSPPSPAALALGVNVAAPPTLVVHLNCAFALIGRQDEP